MNILNILCIIINFAGALAIFLFGMKLTSEGLQKFAGHGMRHIMGKITANPLSGILVGMLLTVVVQSSSASTVMVVSFVNAGMMTLEGAIAVIMGANIGSTLITWILNLFALGESNGAFSLPLLALAVSLCFLFAKKDKLKSIAEFIIGFALLLISMEFLQQAMPNLEEYPQFLEAMGRISGYGFLSVLLFTLIGTLLTCAVQASAAMMAIALTMCYKGWIGFEVAMGLVMGLNIGTTITANIAATVANAVGKKAARSHFVFNLIGAIIVLIAFRPIMYLVDTTTTAVMGASPYETIGSPYYNPKSLPWALCFFHTFFNVINTLILVWFIPQILKIVNWMVQPFKDETEEDEIFKLKYISSHWMNTSELDLEAAQKEIEDFSKRVIRMYNFLPALRTAKNEDEFEKTLKHIEKYEVITDRMELEIAKYLTHVSEGNLSEEGSQKVGAMLRIIDNLESIGDAIYQMALIRKNKREDAVHFSQDLNDNLNHISQLVEKALSVMDQNLHGDYSKADIEAAYQAEDDINEYRDLLRTRHLQSLKAGIYDYAIGSTYSGLYALYEKLADYVINISEAAAGTKRK